MKNFISIIAVVYLLLQSSLIQAQTQEEELKNNEWYVHKVIYNDIEYIAPVNDERQNFQIASFAFSSFYNNFFGYYCYSFGLEEIVFVQNNIFEASTWLSLPMFECQNNDNISFSAKYNAIMMYADNNLLFSYEIVAVDGTTKELVLTNGNGDKAYFYNYYLSNPIFELAGINIYPNPVSDVLQIALPDTAKERYDFKIYDSNGKFIKVFKDKKGQHITLDIEDLASGIYWLEINTPDTQQRGYSTKIIKK